MNVIELSKELKHQIAEARDAGLNQSTVESLLDALVEDAVFDVYRPELKISA